MKPILRGRKNEKLSHRRVDYVIISQLYLLSPLDTIHSTSPTRRKAATGNEHRKSKHDKSFTLALNSMKKAIRDQQQLEGTNNRRLSLSANLIIPLISFRYCEWQHKTVDMSKDIETFEAYMNTLELECDEGPGEAAVMNWTVTADTPDIVYYQVKAI